MKFNRLFEDGLGIGLQRAFKIFLVRADKRVNDARFALAKLRHGRRFVEREVQGSRMVLDMQDKGLSSELYFRGKREAVATDYFQRIVKPGMAVADIGANIGYYALMEARMVGEKGKVYAVEPVDQNVELLRKNVEANKYGNIEVFNMAIGDRDCVKEINLSKQSNLGTFCENHNLDPSGKRKAVKVMSLDSFLKGKRKPDVVRMDVEGYEFEILKGMKKTLAEKGSMDLFIEVHADFLGRDKTVEFYRMLKESGVKTCHVIKESMHVLKFSEKILDKRVLPEQGNFDASIDQMIEDEGFHSGVYHLFARKP